jgi:hypothetical protein
MAEKDARKKEELEERKTEEDAVCLMFGEISRRAVGSNEIGGRRYG